jgi:hypothetical protein
MNTNGELAPRSPDDDLGGPLTLVSARLKKLRRERILVERAIMALTEVARTRHLRDRQAARYELRLDGADPLSRVASYLE